MSRVSFLYVPRQKICIEASLASIESTISDDLIAYRYSETLKHFSCKKQYVIDGDGNDYYDDDKGSFYYVWRAVEDRIVFQMEPSDYINDRVRYYKENQTMDGMICIIFLIRIYILKHPNV